MYNYLDKLARQVCYYDTESEVFMSRGHLPEIGKDEFIGEITN